MAQLDAAHAATAAAGQQVRDAEDARRALAAELNRERTRSGEAVQDAATARGQTAGLRDELDRMGTDFTAARAEAQRFLEESTEARTRHATAVAELAAARLRLEDERAHADQRLVDQREAHEARLTEVRTSYEQRIIELRGELAEARTPASEATSDLADPPGATRPGRRAGSHGS